MLDWFKDPQSKPKTEDDAKKLMESTWSQLCELQLIGCSDQAKTRFDFPDIQFETENLPENKIKDFLKDTNKNKLLLLQGECLFLIGMKLNQILIKLRGQTQNNYIFQDLDKTMIKMAEPALERIALMVLSCGPTMFNLDVNKLIKKLLKKQKFCQNLKIIFLVDNQKIPSIEEAFRKEDYEKENIVHRGLSDLTLLSQQAKLSTVIVIITPR